MQKMSTIHVNLSVPYIYIYSDGGGHIHHELFLTGDDKDMHVLLLW